VHVRPYNRRAAAAHRCVGTAASRAHGGKVGCSLQPVVALGFDGGVEFVPMTLGLARQVVSWCYSPPYDCYDLTDADPQVFCEPQGGFFAVLEGGSLIAYRSFGADGQVPGYEYDTSALDTGGGMRPDLVGRGLGRAVIAAGLSFGRRQYGPAAFRVTVAGFNQRALRVVRSFGFHTVTRFPASTNGRPYEVLLRPETAVGRPNPD
jgi:ribosomal-protein-alanine N-acetyltransferase